MFDFSFSELVVVMLVALIVIGPERLPKVARTAGHLWGRLQRYVHNVKSEIANDVTLEEARKLRSTIRNDLDAIRQSVKETELTLEQSVLQARHSNPSAVPDAKEPSDTQPSGPGKPDVKA